jgi:TM2 domain-containing membrane protein YozV
MYKEKIMGIVEELDRFNDSMSMTSKGYMREQNLLLEQQNSLLQEAQLRADQDAQNAEDAHAHAAAQELSNQVIAYGMKSGMKLVLVYIPSECRTYPYLHLGKYPSTKMEIFYDTTGLFEQYVKEDRAVLGWDYRHYSWTINVTKAQILESAKTAGGWIWVEIAGMSGTKALIQRKFIQDKLEEAGIGNPDKPVRITSANVLLCLREDEIADFPSKVAAAVAETKTAADAWEEAGRGTKKDYKVFDKVPYGILAILLGGLGIQHFYIGKIGMGILSILFCWTGIPALIGLIQGIIALCHPEARLKKTGIFKFEGAEENSAANNRPLVLD